MVASNPQDQLRKVLYMKTLLTISLMAVAHSAWAQGEVDFRNGGITFATVADRKVYRDYVGGQPLTGTNYVAGLWFAPGNDPASVEGRLSPSRGQQAGMTFKFRPTFTGTPGAWVAPQGVSPIFTMDGVDIGQSAMLQVRVWDSMVHASFAEAFAANNYAVSEPFSYTVPPAGSPHELYYMDNLRSFPNPPTGPHLIFNDIVTAEGSNGVYEARFTIRLDGFQPNPVTVTYATEDGTAVAGADYVATNGTLTFAPGELTKTVSVAVTADVAPEPDEVFYLVLSPPVSGTLERPKASCTITEVRIDGISVDTTVRFNTVLGRSYVVERSNNSVDWEPVPGADNVAGTGGIQSIVDPGSGCNPMRSYRARLLNTL
jgi:hypothetical protein